MSESKSSAGFFSIDDDTQGLGMDSIVLNEFLRLRSSDRARGQEGNLEDYQAKFEGYETLIAREWDPESWTLEDISTSFLMAETRTDVARRIGRYEIWGLIGQGGMGRVFRAYDPTLRRDVVLKSLRWNVALHQSMRDRFAREARMVANIRHDGICPALDFFEEDGTDYAVFPYVRGKELGAVLEQVRRAAAPREQLAALLRPKSPRAQVDDFPFADSSVDLACADLVEQIARAAHVAHENGIIHRDLKPANIILRHDGQPVILDFGLARDLIGESEQLTGTGEVLGTPAYMSPEQARGDDRSLGPHTDVWAIGVILFEMLTLQRPFSATDQRLLSEQIVHGEPTRLRTLAPAVSKDLEAICHKALRREPEKRYGSALELAEDLARFRSGGDVAASRVTDVGRFLGFLRRNRGFTVLLLLCAAAALAMRRSNVADHNEAIDRLRGEQTSLDSTRAGQASEAEWRMLERLAKDEGLEGAFAALRENPEDEAARSILRNVSYERAMRGDEEPRILEPRNRTADLRPALRLRDWTDLRGRGPELAYGVHLRDSTTGTDVLAFQARNPHLEDGVVVIPLPADVLLSPGHRYSAKVEPLLRAPGGPFITTPARSGRTSFEVIEPSNVSTAVAATLDIPYHRRALHEAHALWEIGLFSESLRVIGEAIPARAASEKVMRDHVRARLLARLTERVTTGP